MPAIDLYYSVATSQLDAQMQQIDQLHAKVAGAYTSATAILAVFAGLLALATVPVDGWGRAIVLGCFCLAAVFYVVLAVCLCAAYRVSNWSSRPDLHDLRERAQAFSDGAMRVWIADECLQSYTDNRRRIAVKLVILPREEASDEHRERSLAGSGRAGWLIYAAWDALRTALVMAG